MASDRTLLVLAGPNGSGKSTITQGIPIVGVYVNADQIQKALHCDSLKAAQTATATREYLLSQGQSFTFETVMSTPRNIELMQRAKENGYNVQCIYVLTVHPDINVRRVAVRRLHGGHDVPEDKIRQRYERAMALIPQLLTICDRLLIYDNSSDRGEGFSGPIVEYHDGHLKTTPNSYWSSRMIEQLLAGEYSSAAEKQN